MKQTIAIVILTLMSIGKITAQDQKYDSLDITMDIIYNNTKLTMPINNVSYSLTYPYEIDNNSKDPARFDNDLSIPYLSINAENIDKKILTIITDRKQLVDGTIIVRNKNKNKHIQTIEFKKSKLNALYASYNNANYTNNSFIIEVKELIIDDVKITK